MIAILTLVMLFSTVPKLFANDDLLDLDQGLENLDEDREEEIADEIEDEIELEDDLEEELQDKLEDELEDRIEAMVEEGTITEEMEDALEDQLEEMIERGQLAGHNIESQIESLIEAQLNTLPGQYDDLFNDQSQLADIEQALMDLEVFAMEDEFIALMDEDILEEAKRQGANIISVEAMDELGQLLVTFGDEPPAQVQTESQANHIYTLDAQSEEQAQPSTNIKSTESLSLLQASAFVTNTPLSNKAMRIGMMDSAIQSNHICFQRDKVKQKTFTPSAAQQDYQHGTAMASAINQCGLLSSVELFNAEVFARTPKGLVIASAADLIKGLNWLLKQKVQAINLSLSGPPNQVLARVLKNVMERGTVIIASVGNEGAAAFPRYPAAQSGVIAITAIDKNLNVFEKAVRGTHVDFAVPGVSILLADPNGEYTIKTGTSVANAVATPIILHSLQSGKTLQSLKSNTKDLGEKGKDKIFGYGLLQTNF
ncbi:S8 family serine peptidase [Bermanella marisrubri]|uniref:Possible protease n=1 Tax=Bermanella marisrubri TaxID=207949 RepID=Q1N4A4_9GAMM|nr:S8 family serine peptidase [Bermanella marisrubri]EAT12961.1 possible protease [Oceanobacter sp. RED65] [Bermanella marisrubri]QIZ82911.1 S8 family serine peptidase [Bermanella marisrubri]